MEVPRVVTDVQWSKQANDWVPIITIGTGESAVKYYGIRCPHDGSMNRIPDDVIAAEDRGQRSVGRAGKAAERCKAGRNEEMRRRDEMRRADSRREGETVNAFFVYSCARSLNNIAYTITPYYDDVIGTNTCPAMAMVTDNVLQEVEVVTESSVSWRLQEDSTKDNYGEMVMDTEEVSMKTLEIMPMMQRVSQMSPAENALMRWRIAGPSKGGDAEKWQSEMIELRRGKRGTLEAWTLQGRKLATREALRTLNTLAADYELRARHYEKEMERIEREEKVALRAAERYARRKGFSKEKEEAAQKVREIAARRRAIEETHAVVYVPEDPSSERCRKDTARRSVRPGQKVEEPEERIERIYSERQEKAMQEMRERADKRRKREKNERDVRRCAEPEVVWYKPRRAVGTATAGSLAEAVCIYENTGTESYAQSNVSGPRATPTAQLTKRADTKSNVINTVTATPWRTEREPGSRYQEVDGEYEAVLPETKEGKTVDMEQAGQVEITKYAVLGEPISKPDLKKARTTAERSDGKDSRDKRMAKSGLRSIRSKRRLGEEKDKEDGKDDERDRPVEAPDQFTAVRLTTEHATNTNWTLAATALGDKVRKGEITAEEANDLSTRYAPTMQGSFMFPVISYPAIETVNGQASATATRNYIPHLCLGEIGETGDGSDYASTFGDRKVFVDKGSFTSSMTRKTDSVEVIPGKQCEIEKEEVTGGVAISFYTKRNNGNKTSVLRMPKRGAVWCCSCPYAMTEYANTPYQQTNHRVVTTVNSMPTITMGAEPETLGGTAMTEYFSQFVNAGLAMYKVGKQEEFWAAVGTLNLSPTAVSMLTGSWSGGGFTGWSNVDATTGEVLMPAMQTIPGTEHLQTQNVVEELKPKRNSENMWECAWNSKEMPEPVRDYSLAEMVADAGSFFGTWLETSNGCDMSNFSGEGQAVFCSFNIRGGIVANTLVFVGNSFGERLGRGESGDEPGPGPDPGPTPTTPDVVVFECVESCPSSFSGGYKSASRRIYPTSVTNVSNTSEYLVQVVYEYPGTYSFSEDPERIRFRLDDFMDNLTVPEGLVQYGDYVTEVSDTEGYVYKVTLTYQAYNKTTAKYVWTILTLEDVMVTLGETSDFYPANLIAELTEDNEYMWIFTNGGPIYIIDRNSLIEKLISAYDESGAPSGTGTPGDMFSITPDDSLDFEYVATLPNSIAEIDLRVSKFAELGHRNSTRQNSRNNQPQRVNTEARKWIEARKKREAEERKRKSVKKDKPLKDEEELVWPIQNETILYSDGVYIREENSEITNYKFTDDSDLYIQFVVSDYTLIDVYPEIQKKNVSFIMTAINFQSAASDIGFTPTNAGANGPDIQRLFRKYIIQDYLAATNMYSIPPSFSLKGIDGLPRDLYYPKWEINTYMPLEPEEPSDNSYGSPVTEITIPARVRGAGKPEDDEKAEGVTIPVTQLVQPILTTSTNLLMQVDQYGIPCRLKRNGKWETDDSNEDGIISLDPNSFSRMSSLRRPHYSQQMTGRWWSLGDVPLTFISEKVGYKQIRGGIVGLFTGVIDFFDMEKQVVPTSIKVFDQEEERDVGIFPAGNSGSKSHNNTLEKAVTQKSGRKGAQRTAGRSVENIEDWADPSTNNYEHEGKGVFGRKVSQTDAAKMFADPLATGVLDETAVATNRDVARTLVSDKTGASANATFTPPVAPLFFWHVSWSVNFASPVAKDLKVLPTDIPATEGETYYAKPLFGWTYGVPKTMPNVALMSNIADEARRYVKISEDTGKEYMDREMTKATENNVVEFMPGMFGAASLLNVGCDASVDLVAYSTST